MSNIHMDVKELLAKRRQVNKEIDAELARLRVLCDHERKKFYPSRRCGERNTECLDCGKWW